MNESLHRSVDLVPRARAAMVARGFLPDFGPQAVDELSRVLAGTAVSGAFSFTFQRALAMAAAFSWAFSSVQSSLTPVTPGRDSTRAFTSRCNWARRGHPAVVRAMVTTTRPSGLTSTRLAMPSSTMSLPSSGSMTPRSRAMTSSGWGGATTESSMPRFYREVPCNLVW